MIKVVINSPVTKIVVDKYTALYQQRRKSLGRAYPRAQFIANIRAALSCNGEFISETELREPIINSWKTKKYKVYKYRHWFYAVVLRLNSRGDVIAVSQDARYKSDYHYDVLQAAGDERDKLSANLRGASYRNDPNEKEAYAVRDRINMNKVERRNSVIIKESRLRKIIKEAIREYIA